MVTPLNISKKMAWSIFIVLCFLGIAWYYQKDKVDPKINELKAKLVLLDPRFEDVYIRDGESSYTINQKYITLCLKDANNQYYNDSTLMYVLIHEAAHTLEGCPIDDDTDGHCLDFVRTFNHLLAKAINLGIYDPRVVVPVDYCSA